MEYALWALAFLGALWVMYKLKVLALIEFLIELLGEVLGAIFD